MKAHRALALSVLRALAACMVSVLLVTACGGGGGDSGSASGGEAGGGSVTIEPPPPGSDYFPLATGDRWLYQDTYNGTSTIYQVDVGATVTVNGQARTSLVTSTPAGEPIDVSRYASTAAGVTTYPADGDAVEMALGPYMLLQLPVQPGNSFVQLNKTLDSGSDVDGDGVHERLLLLSTVQVIARSPLTTPAGTFGDALHVRTTVRETMTYSRSGDRLSGSVISDDWYVAGVGRVRADVVASVDGQPGSTVSTVLLAYRVGGTHGGSAPTVASVTPADSKVHNGAVAVTATFSVPMDGANLNAGGFTVADAAGRAVVGSATLTPDGMSATFVPAAGWASGTYTAAISAAATDRQGNTATPNSWTFTLDTVAPMLVQAMPADGATGVATNAKLSYVFSEPLDPVTVMPGSNPVFTITDDATGVAAPVLPAFDGVSTISFTPRTYWPHGHSYTVTFPAGMADLIGNTLGVNRQVHFSTAPSLFADPLPQATTFGQQPVTAIGDINGDGLPDVVWAAWDMVFPPQVHLFMRLGLADGTWAPAVEPIAAPVYPCSVFRIAIGDSNADGRNDLVLGGSCGIRVLLQEASGGFAKGPVYPLPGYDYGGVVKLVDLDGDGRLDMLSAGNSSAFRIWRQTSAGTFVETASVETGLGSLTDLELADLNGDGILDVVATSIGMQDNRLAVLHGQPGGGFGLPSAIPTGDGWPSGVGIGDVDGDGRPDLVVSIANGTIPRIVVLHQSADQGFSATATMTVLRNPFGVSLVDVNGDGRLDIVLGHDDAFAVLPRLADGTFGSEDLYGVPQVDVFTQSLVVGPRDAQGRLVIEFNGQLFRPLALAAPSRARSAQRPPQLYDRMGVLPSMKR